MPASFFSLPAELRNEIYMYLLVRRRPIIDLWYGYRGLTPSLLSTNTKILHEARSLLYGDNCFDFTGWQSDHIYQFLDGIGSINASHIRCIRTDFPRLLICQRKISLELHSFQRLKKIQYHCTNLEKVTITPGSIYALEHQPHLLNSPKICAKALMLVDACFREIPSLQEIVEAFEERPSSYLRREMKDHGWILNVVVPTEDWVNDYLFRNQSYSLENCDNEDYYYDDYYDDDYYDDDYYDDDYGYDDYWNENYDDDNY